MRLTEIDGYAERFQQYGNDFFDPLCQHYESVCRNWYTHLAKYMPLDRDEFYNDFHSLLFRALKKYNPDRLQVSDKPVISQFDRYFSAAVRKMSMGLKRARMTKKRQSEKYTISLSTARIDIPDNRMEYIWEMIEIMDVISSVRDPIDRKVLIMRLNGSSRQDVCDALKMPLHTYRACLARIQKTPAIVSLESKL